MIPIFDPTALFPRGADYVREYFEAASISTQTPPEMVASLGLAVASATLCNVVRVAGDGDHVEIAPLWMLVLAEPASRKTKVISELQAPIIEWEKQRAKELSPVIAAATQRRKIAEYRLKRIENEAATAKDSQQSASLTADAERLAQEIQAEPIPTKPQLLASEPTPEGLSRLMVSNHGRALLASAEADALDIMQGRYSDRANYGIFLKGHAGDAVRAQRAGRDGDMIDHPALAVAMCVQPQAVRELWRDRNASGRGLLARFAVILPPDIIGRRDVRPPAVPPSMRERWQAALARLLTFEPSDKPPVIRLGRDADALFLEFQKRTESALGDGELSDRQAWGGKLCGMVLRIALTLHALQAWALAGKPEDFPAIDADTMRAAIAWGGYLAQAERHAREGLAESPGQQERRQLVEWIESKGGAVTVRELTRGPQKYRGKPDAAFDALDELVAAGLGEWERKRPGPSGGQPARRFKLHPTGDGDDTTADNGESESNVTVASVTTPTDAGAEREVA